jgi:hypothetical protein
MENLLFTSKWIVEKGGAYKVVGGARGLGEG